MEIMLEGTGLTELDLDQDPQASLKNKMGNFDEVGLQKAYTWAHGKHDKTVTIANRSRQIGSKFQTRKNIESPAGLNIPHLNIL